MKSKHRSVYWNDFRLVEYRPDKFVTVIEGEIVRRSTKADHMLHKILQRGDTVNTGDLQIVLAVCAVTIVAATSTTSIITRALSIIGFIMGLLSAVALSSVYFAKRLPSVMLYIYERVNSPAVVVMFPLLFWRWLRSLIKFVMGEYDPDMDIEIGYLSLLVALILTLIVFLSWLAES